MTVNDLSIKQSTEGVAVSTAAMTGDHLRLVARRLTELAAELDAGSKVFCCGEGLAWQPQLQENGGLGVFFSANLHFVDVVNTNAHKH